MHKINQQNVQKTNGTKGHQAGCDNIVRAHGHGTASNLKAVAERKPLGSSVGVTSPTQQQQQPNSREKPTPNRETVEAEEEEEFDEERELLIAGFQQHLSRNVPKEDEGAIGQRGDQIWPKAEATSKINRENQSDKCDRDQPDTPRAPAEGTAPGQASGDKMKYDYKRDHPDTMCSGKNAAKNALNYKKTYLFLYNLGMFIMFLMVHIILTIKGLAGKMDDESVQGAALIIKLLTYTQLMESIHPMLGLVPGGPWMPFLQVIGRLLVNHFLTEPEIRLSSAPYAHYLFIVWSSIEIFRYSFYALRVFNVEIYPITWCRYTLFMPLYPMGGFCEAQIVMATVKHYEKTGAYSVELPNAANFSFSLPTFLRFYTVALLGPSIFYLMKYMWSQRCRQLKQKVE